MQESFILVYLLFNIESTNCFQTYGSWENGQIGWHLLHFPSALIQCFIPALWTIFPSSNMMLKKRQMQFGRLHCNCLMIMLIVEFGLLLPSFMRWQGFYSELTMFYYFLIIQAAIGIVSRACIYFAGGPWLGATLCWRSISGCPLSFHPAVNRCIWQNPGCLKGLSPVLDLSMGFDFTFCWKILGFLVLSKKEFV